MPLDPFDFISRDPVQALLASAPRFRSRPRSTFLPALDPEETSSGLADLGRSVIGGVAYAGETLDKPGSALRGLLAGNPAELANLIPFSDTLGITSSEGWLGGTPLQVTDDEKTVYGRDLLEKWGLANPNKPGLFNSASDAAGDIGGLALEIGLDPLTYLSFGASAFGKAGKVAKAVGKAPLESVVHPTTLALTKGKRTARITETLADRLRGATPEVMAHADAAAKALGSNLPDLMHQPLGGLFRWGLPFTDIEYLGRGAPSRAIAGLLDQMGASARYSPLGVFMAKNFSAAAQGANSPLGQMMAKTAFKNKQEAVAAAGTRASEQAFRLKDAGVLDEREAFRQLREGLGHTTTDPTIRQIVDETRFDDNALYAEMDSIGMPAHQWTSQWGAEHSPRQYTGPTKMVKEGKASTLSTSDPYLKARKTDFDVPGATEGLNKMGRDDRLVKSGKLKFGARKEIVAKEYLGMTDPDIAELGRLETILKSGGTLNTAEEAAYKALSSRYSQAHGLARWFGRFPETFEPFANHPLVDSMGYQVAGRTALENGKAIHDFIQQTAEYVDVLGGAPASSNLIPLEKALTGTGLSGEKATQHAIELMKEHADPTLKGLAMVLDHSYKTTGKIPDHLLPLLESIQVPEDLVTQARRLLDFQKPGAQGALKRAFLGWTDWFRTMVTTPFPAFHTRNAFSEFWNHLIVDGGDPRRSGVMRYIQPYRDASTLISGKTIADANQIPGLTHMTPEEATRALAIESKWRGQTNQGRTRELTRGQIDPIEGEGLLQSIPGQNPMTLRREIGEAFTRARGEGRSALAPWNVSGVGPSLVGGQPMTADKFLPVDVGRRVGNRIEDVSRLATYIGKRRQGFTPAMAQEASHAAHVDYRQSLSTFERSYMKKLVPFYCVPDDCEILTRDGWRTVDGLIAGSTEVLVYEHHSGEAHWEILNKVATFDFDGDLNVVGGVRGNFSCTEDHGWPIFTQRGHRRLAKAKDLKDGHRIPLVPENCVLEQRIECTKREAALIGWLYTDGYHRPGEAYICQKKPHHLAAIRSLLGDDIQRESVIENGTVYLYLKLELRHRLLSLCGSHDDLSRFATRISRENLEALWQAMWDADGGERHRSGAFFAAEDAATFDAFQIASALLGKVVQGGKRGGYLRKAHTSLKVKTGLREKYRGRVWCPELNGRCWLMRRNGRIVLTQNTWTRMQGAWQAKMLMERPGGLAAQAIRTSNQARSERFVPEHVGRGLAIPIGDTSESGIQRFLSRIDLPHESLLEKLPFGHDTLSTAKSLTQGILSEANPYLKAPLELAFGRQLYSGRELAELDSRLGRIAEAFTGGAIGHNQIPILLEQIALNSPASRALTTTGMVLDPRKYTELGGVPGGALLANLLTGAKFSDVDVVAAQEREGLNLIANKLKGNPAARRFETLYVRPEDELLLSDQEKRLIQLYKGIRRQRSERYQREYGR